MLLAFPYMHAELFPDESVEGITFFDPGMTEAAEEGMFRPDDLPLDPKTATALINDCIKFGEQFKDPGEMAYFGAATADDFYEGTSMSIQAQLTRQFEETQGGKEEREAREAASRAQFILLLAWFYEEKIMELVSIEQGVKDSWKSMDNTLGVDEDDHIDERVLSLGNVESHTGGASDEQSVQLPWQRTIEALPAFVDKGTVLVCPVPEIFEVWDDLGIEFTDADSSLGLPEGAQVATLPAWRFGGRRAGSDKLPLTLKELTVAVIR